jgi:hypothetical protein
MDRISVDIVSPKLTDKGKRTEILMFISFGLLFLSYPINLSTGDGVLYKSLIGVLISNMLFWVIYYYFTTKHDTIGRIIFEHDQLIVEEKSGVHNFRIVDISNLTISYNGFEDEPFLTFQRPFMRVSSGHENILSFQSGTRTHKYRFVIINKTVRTFLYRQVGNYKNLGLNIRIVEKQEFVEF